MSEQRLLDLWLPPQDCGEPVACLATSFTFDTDFFRDDCLGRFLGMRASVGESAVGELAQINELEERLAQVTVTALVDRSATVDSRNLRWDLVPVTVPTGLLHSKTALLMWESTARVIIGSANLTPAGYRYQRELAIALDLVDGTEVPRAFWDAYLTEWRRLIDLMPDDITVPGPKKRAVDAWERALGMLDRVDPPASLSNARVVLAPSRLGESALPYLSDTVVGNKPRYLTALSPFWDSEDKGRSDAIRGLTGLLASTGPAEAAFMVPLRATVTGDLVQAPRDLPDRVTRPGIDTSLWGVEAGGSTAEAGTGDLRRLHAKALMLHSDTWVTVMIGSSNMTAAGLGLHPHHGHVELNVILGAPLTSDYGRALEQILPPSVQLDPASIDHEAPDSDEDEPIRPPLPAAFQSATLEHARAQWRLHLALALDDMPSEWRISTPTGHVLLTSGDVVTESIVTITLDDPDDLPQGLQVVWQDETGAWQQAEWVINVADPSTLPMDHRLQSIPIDLLVQALASRSVDPAQAIERLLDGLSDPDTTSPGPYSALDPLQRFDDSRALLRRMQVYGRALDNLTEHLSRPAPTASSLAWRLTGLISPTRIAEGWAHQCTKGELPVELAHFLFAELHLALARVDWEDVTKSLPTASTGSALSSMRERISRAQASLPPLPPGHQLGAYARKATQQHER